MKIVNLTQFWNIGLRQQKTQKNIFGYKQTAS